MIIRKSFPQVYKLVHPKTQKPYYLVAARKHGFNERKIFGTEQEALDYARQIAEDFALKGPQPAVPKDVKLRADAYQKLVDRLTPHCKTPEDAVSFYVGHLGREAIRQAQPFLKELVNEWETEKLTSKIRPLAERTKPELKQYARFLRRTWGDEKAHDVARKMVEDALNKLPAKNRNTHRKYLRYIRMFFIWLKDHRRIAENPTDGIKIKGESYEAHSYKPALVENLLRHILKDEHRDLIGFYALLIFAGLRPSEGARVLWQDIDFNTGELYVRKGKKEARRFILHPTALKWMEYHKAQSPKDAPFVQRKNLSNREKRVRSILGGEWIQDGLRHGMATYYNALVGDPYKVAAVLGDNIQTIKRHYMRTVAEAERKAFWELTPANVLASKHKE